MKDAVQEFNTSSYYLPPQGFDAWKIRNNYPTESAERPTWLDINFLHGEDFARAYCEAVKAYIIEGNAEHNFAVEHNQDRDWYHPPWLHYGKCGREPISGLKYAGRVEKNYISDKQNRILQGWLTSYFNAPAATVLHKMWGNPDRIPVWDKDNLVKFPPGSLIFENIFCDVTDAEVYTFKNAPTTSACIFENSQGVPDLSKRKNTADRLRLIQTDFAARDPRFDGLGWVFGTFIHDGTKAKPSSNSWGDLIPVGLQWGNDPTLTQEAHDNGKLSKECWINGHALDVIKSLKGDRPWLGWHGRLDGVADDFMSSCTSCHATVQITPDGKRDKERKLIMDPPPTKIPNGGDKPGIYVQEHPEAIQHWFRNVPAGEPFTTDHLSADYNQHVLLAYLNYQDWKDGKVPDCSAPTNVAFKRGY